VNRHYIENEGIVSGYDDLGFQGESGGKKKKEKPSKMMMREQNKEKHGKEAIPHKPVWKLWGGTKHSKQDANESCKQIAKRTHRVTDKVGSLEGA